MCKIEVIFYRIKRTDFKHTREVQVVEVSCFLVFSMQMQNRSDPMVDIDLWREEENSNASWFDITDEDSGRPFFHMNTWEKVVEADSDSDMYMSEDEEDWNLREKRELQGITEHVPPASQTSQVKLSASIPKNFVFWSYDNKKKKRKPCETLPDKVMESTDMVSRSLPNLGVWNIVTKSKDSDQAFKKMKKISRANS